MTNQVLPTINTAMVAFIDLLGFRNMLKAANTDETLQDIYQKLVFVHDQFDKNSSDDITEETNKQSSKKILALSDAIILGIDFSSELIDVCGLIDVLSSEIYGIGLSQAMCHAQGIFLRGCVSMGPFYSHGDYIISKAMSDAYEGESNETIYPVIRLKSDLSERLKSDTGNRAYGENNKPMEFLLKEYSLPDGSKGEFIDYLRIGIDATEDWYCENDRQSYLSEKDENRKLDIMRQSYRKSQIAFLEAVSQEVKKAITQDLPPSVISKYEWTGRYLNSHILEFCPERTDLLVCYPPFKNG